MSGKEHFFTSIREIAQRRGLDITQKLCTLLELGCEQFGTEIGLVIHNEGDDFTVLASCGEHGGTFTIGACGRLSGTPCAKVLELSGYYAVDTPDGCHAKYPNACVPFTRYIGIPVQFDGEVLGTICFIQQRPIDRPVGAQTEDEIGILMLTAAGLIERHSHIESINELKRAATIVSSSDEAIFTLSADRKIMSWNRAAEQLYGYPARQAIGLQAETLFRAADQVFAKQMFESVWRGRTLDGVEVINVCEGGRERTTCLTLSPICDNEGRIVSAAAVVRDIDERKRAEKALAESEQRYALAARGANDGLWDWDLLSGDVYYSPRWKSIVGYAEDEVAPTIQAWRELIHKDDLNQFDAHLATHLAGKDDKFYNEHRLIGKDGEDRWVLCRGVAVRDEQGEAVRIAGSLTDITHQKRSEAALIQLAQQDRLTRLPNRAFFTEILRSALARTRRNPNYKFAILFLDFDRFKVINDSLGHEYGDMLLINIAQQLRVQLRTVDTAARLGGDEFVVLLDGIDGLGGAIEAAERLLATFARPHSLKGHEVISTASIGIVTSDGKYTKPDEMIRDADTAMYQAKAAGKARYVVFDENMHAAALERLNMEKELRKAITMGQLWLVYQPIVSLATSELLGFEALIRWEHTELGIIPPDVFISLAEETGDIVPIGDWVLRSACQQLKAWKAQLPEAVDLYMNVNLSKRQLAQPDKAKKLKRLFDEVGVDPHDIKLEITESVIMDDANGITPVLDQIRALGVQLAMDDFGTGHSSLSCLHQFPIDVLKIDREFIRNMEQRIEFTAVIQAIVTLAQTIGISVVAEGLETHEQVAQLQALECDCAQGFYFAKPMLPEQAAEFIRQGRSHRKSA